MTFDHLPINTITATTVAALSQLVDALRFARPIEARLIQSEETTDTSEGVAAIAPNGRCRDVVHDPSCAESHTTPRRG